MHNLFSSHRPRHIFPSILRFLKRLGLSLASLFMLLGLPGIAFAQADWFPTASMNTARQEHTATPLADGSVLIAGGFNGSTTFASAERYTPEGTWSVVPSMGNSRAYHTATTLANGKVLVLGGKINQQTLNSAELFDPSNNTWTPAASMAHARSDHTATLLADGKVLVVGGAGGTSSYDAELYDPASNSWTPAASMKKSRSLHTATLLPDGKVMVTGGLHGSLYVPLVFELHSATEIYDPVSNTWNDAGSMASPRMFHTATLLANGKVLVVGGRTMYEVYSSAELYDPSSRSWSSAGNMTSSRVGHRATLLSNGKVLVDGGAALSVGSLYDPVGNSWTDTGNVVNAHYGHTATLLPSGRVLVAGGVVQNAASANAELYAPSANTVTTNSVPGMTGAASATLAGGGAGCILQQGTGFSATAAKPGGKRLPYGQFAFQAVGCNPGSSVTLTLTYPQPLAADVTFLKFGPPTAGAASTWFQWTGATLSSDRRSVSYVLTDNGPGDSDPAAGRFSDPFAPAVAAVNPAAAPVSIPVDAPWMLVLLSALVGTLAWRRRTAS